jgi:mutator protein MutT
MVEKLKGDPVEVVGAVIRDRGQILLGLRASHRRSCASCWDVIGGHVNKGETLLDALTRELAEEIGILSECPRAFRTLILDDVVDGRMLLHLFLIEHWVGTPTLANGEHTELCWFRPKHAAALPNLAAVEYRSIFRSL